MGPLIDAAQADEEPAVPAATTGRAATRALDVVVITRSDEGSVFCAIWREPPGFPIERAKAAYEAVGRPIRDGRTHLRFEAVASGSAALACFHDENANRTLDTSWIGIPSEGTGASNDARGFMGPPRYEDARFEISHDDPPQLTIHMQYGLLGGSPDGD
jgi:uncharacterized protein (DUF2141 family)